MIKIIIDNEDLDLPGNQIVTIKKSQNLNGVQNQYSFSNNFNLPSTAKNQRLLKINYLPNSKAKSMTQGYDCDMVINGCIFLKNQKLKIQKQTDKNISVYLVFSENIFIKKSKEVLLNDINLEVIYDKSIFKFLQLNESTGFIRTAPISAQNESKIVVLEEVPTLINVVKLIEKIVLGLGYSFYGDFFTNLTLKEYYLNPNFSIYGVGGAPKFDNKLNCFQFLTSILKTFNAYIDPSDSDKSIGIFLWNEIDNLKKNFVDYSDYFEKFNDYAFEGGLSKINTIEYSGSQPFFNSFFENNKSIVEKSNYLKSDFGAGSLRLFSDQELTETFTLPLRLIGEVSETTEINIFKFENIKTTNVYFVNGTRFSSEMYKAFSPNILEIFNDFHLNYVKNISLPTVANLQFRYDAIFLTNFKMQNIFFVKNLSTYWLPLELNYSTKKDKINVKCLMIEKTAVEIPVVYDLTISFGFLEKYKIINASPLYSTQNTSPQSIFSIKYFNENENKIFVTGNNGIRTEIFSTPINIDIASNFILEFENIQPTNKINVSRLLFSFISEEGGVSRIAKISIDHNGFANYISEFRLPSLNYVYTSSAIGNNIYFLNVLQKITTLANIPTTNAIAIGQTNSQFTAINNTNVISLSKNQRIKFNLKSKSQHNLASFSPFNYLEINYYLFRNNFKIHTFYSKGQLFAGPTDNANFSYEFNANYEIDALLGDNFSLFMSVQSIPLYNDQSILLAHFFDYMNLKISVIEQL
ncbi:hypothetical protein [Flavobacterium sp.]|uniref:hypothetical protein n=1 Tax=Flavobacterium sp. TaxID=239 RepID=UPI0037506999